MKQRLPLILLLTILGCSHPRAPATVAVESARTAAPARPWPPTFAGYATSDTLTGPAAPIDYAFNPEIRRFRSQVEGSRSSPADFDGHYRFVVWGCGTQCTSHVILDLRTGRTYDDTLVDFSCGAVDYRKESGLVIAGPDTVSMVWNNSCALLPTRYLVWNGTALVELHPEGKAAIAWADSAKVTTVDSLITIPLKGGRILRLVSGSGDGEGARSFTYDRHLSSAPFHLVEVHYYESLGFDLIHDSTGKRSELSGEPLPSPNGSQIAAWAPGAQTEEEPSGIWLYQVQGDSVISEWVHEDGDWGARDLVWVGEDSLQFIRMWPRRYRRPGHERPALLVRIGGAWNVEGEVPDTLVADSASLH